jgi:hypothetical protein
MAHLRSLRHCSNSVRLQCYFHRPDDPVSMPLHDPSRHSQFTGHYGRDAGTDAELFAIPITIANDGARSGTIISMELEVQNLKTNTSKRYYSAFVGEHPREAAAPNRQFAPLSIPGRAVFSETVRFYPTGNALPRRLATFTAEFPDLTIADVRSDLPWGSHFLDPVAEALETVGMHP